MTKGFKAAACALLGAAWVLAAGWPATAGAGSVPTAKPESVGLSTERLQRVHTAMQAQIEAGNIAGVVTLVARRGRIAHLEAQGVAESGDIRLSDPVSKFIPEFAAPAMVAVAKPNGAEGYDLISATRAVTVGDLLKHGSGLLSGGLGNRVADKASPRVPTDTLATYIPKLGKAPLDFQPGTLWRYSGLAGFDVLSRIVEVVSGQTYDKYLDEHLFKPLGMKDTGFSFSDSRAQRVASMHTRREGKLDVQPRTLDPVFFSGADSLAATAEDYLQLAQMLLNGGELNGKRFLSPRTIELMTSNHTGDMVNGQFGRPAHGMGFGLSMQVVQDPLAAELAVSKGAYGWAGGTGVSFWIEPTEQMVTIFFIQGGQAAIGHAVFENAVRQAIVN
ncbi:MAG: serine hydrolase domain-containing protein [Gammaproteobacteria bacterium]